MLSIYTAQTVIIKIPCSRKFVAVEIQNIIDTKTVLRIISRKTGKYVETSEKS